MIIMLKVIFISQCTSDKCSRRLCLYITELKTSQQTIKSVISCLNIAFLTVNKQVLSFQYNLKLTKLFFVQKKKTRKKVKAVPLFFMKFERYAIMSTSITTHTLSSANIDTI